MERALQGGILDPDEWRFVFVGEELPEVDLPGAPAVVRYEDLQWEAYAEAIRSAHLGMSLVHTPHPGYPLLHLAASGAVVVTNGFSDERTDLSGYSRNIMWTGPTVEQLCDGIAQAVELEQHPANRRANYVESGFCRRWAETLAPVVDQVVAWVGR